MYPTFLKSFVLRQYPALTDSGKKKAVRGIKILSGNRFDFILVRKFGKRFFEMITLYPCNRTVQDAKLVFSWRNDPATVAAAYLPLPKTWDAFLMEYEECYFGLPDFPPFFILKNGLPAGFMRFDSVRQDDLDGRTVLEIMINVAPEHRRKGTGFAAVQAAKTLTESKGVAALIADIRKENTASRRLFEKSGFTILHERTEFIEKINEKSRILCYRYML